MLAGPLDDVRLKAVEDCLNEPRLDEAQRLLAALGAAGELGAGIAYLSARLLFHRGRLDAASFAARLREVLGECPSFAEARGWLETVEHGTPANRRLETPRVPDPAPGHDVAVVDMATNLGELELPKSELPTEPAPPPDSDAGEHPFELEPREQEPSPWHPIEVELAKGHRSAVLAGLDRLARDELDAVLARQKPNLPELAGVAAAFLVRSPVTSHFAPFDLSLASLDRLDALIGVLVPPGVGSGAYALRVLLSVYLGECVRQSSGGSWDGALIESETAAVLRGDERYVPWQELASALEKGRSLRANAGPPPHPGAEPAEGRAEVHADAPTPWDPKPWPSLALVREMGRALPSSVIGVWAERCAKIPLDRTPGSLSALDRYVELVVGKGALPSPTPIWARRAAVLSGSYIGELLCLHSAGQWSENDLAPEGPLRLEVLLPDGRAVYPLLSAYERIGGKRGASFATAFRASLGGK